MPFKEELLVTIWMIVATIAVIVFFGVLVFLASFGDWAQTAHVITNLILLIIFFYLLALAGWLSSRSRKKASSDGQIARLKPGAGKPGIDWTLDFTGSVRELLELEQARRKATSSVNIFLLGVPLFFGALWGLSSGTLEYTEHLILLGFTICLFELCDFAVKPFLVRWKIRRCFPKLDVFSINVGAAGFRLAASSSRVDRRWAELSEVKDTHLGIKLYWTDGTKNWLPGYILDPRPLSEVPEDGICIQGQ